jgi:arabinose-5-phosphate isomerase
VKFEADGVGASCKNASEHFEWHDSKADGCRGCGGRIASDVGDFYPGDFARHFQRVEGIADRAVGEFLTREPVTVEADALWVRPHRFDELVVVNGTGMPVGLVDSQDLPWWRLV